QHCFDVLMEARERFYASPAWLIDLTLVAPTTAGDALRRELAGATPKNLGMSAQTGGGIAAAQPATLEALAAALAGRRATLVGGEFSDRELPLLPLESIHDELAAGAQAYLKHLNCRPEVFGRRRFGITPALPQMLARWGFVGAVHATLDD